MLLATVPASPHASACDAMARTLNGALDGAPIEPEIFAAACRSGGIEPEQTLARLVGAGLVVVRGNKLHLSEVSRVLVTYWYLFA